MAASTSAARCVSLARRRDQEIGLHEDSSQSDPLLDAGGGKREGLWTGADDLSQGIHVQDV